MRTYTGETKLTAIQKTDGEWMLLWTFGEEVKRTDCFATLADLHEFCNWLGLRIDHTVFRYELNAA